MYVLEAYCEQRPDEISQKAGRTQKIVIADGPFCHYCGTITIPWHETYPGDPQLRTVDRIVPGLFGGTYDFENVVIACGKCNSSLGHIYPKCECVICEGARVAFEADRFVFVPAQRAPVESVGMRVNLGRQRACQLHRPGVAF